MEYDRSNMSKERVRVGSQKAGPVSMQLPRQDDGKVHTATGKRDNTSAAHYADAMDSVVGRTAGMAHEQSSGR